MDVKEGTAPQEQQKVLDFYTKFGPTTEPGRHLELLRSLPSDVQELAPIIKGWQFHPVLTRKPELLKDPYLVKAAKDLKAEYEQAGKQFITEDEELNTVPKIINAVLERDSDVLKGEERWFRNRVRFSCAGVAYLVAAVEKAHGIPARVRAGFADWFPETPGGKYIDHWITEIWNDKENRWNAVDMDGIYDIQENGQFPWYDLPEGKFVYGSEAWLKVRDKEMAPREFWHTLEYFGGRATGQQMSYDYSQITGDEWTYWHYPRVFHGKNYDTFRMVNPQLAKFDHMAELMQDPDKNFDAIQSLYKENPIFHPVKYED